MTAIADSKRRVTLRSAKPGEVFDVAIPEEGKYILTKLEPARPKPNKVRLVRGKDGFMHAMLNACRHRAMKLVPEGCGSARRFTCVYHGWTYETDGSLAGVPGEETFGPVDRAEHSLVRLACEERAGFIFVCLTAGLSMDE